MSRALLTSTIVMIGTVLAVPTRAAIEDEDPTIDGKKLSEWVVMLQTGKEEAHRTLALIKLKKIGVRLESPKVAPPVIQAARDDASDGVRRYATQVLGDLAFSAYDSLDVRRRQENKKSEIAKAILKQTYDALIEQLKVDKAAEVRKAAAEGLGRLGVGAQFASDALTAALKDKADPVRAAAAEALGRIGPGAKTAAPLLVELLKDKKADRLVRVYAAYSLGRVTPMQLEPVVDALREALGEPDADLRKSAADALSELGEAAAPAVPALAAALKDKNNLEVRRAAANALGQVGPGAAKALPELRQAVKDEDKFVRCHALRAIGGLGKDGGDAVPDLVRCLKEDSNTEVRVAAIEALGSLGLKVAAAVDALTAASRSSQTAIREAAQEALKKIEGK